MEAPFALTSLFIALVLAPAVSPARAQESPSAPDPVILSANTALQDGRDADAENILSDAIRQSDLSASPSPRLASYLEELASLIGQKGRTSEAIALDQRAAEINRNSFGPN